MTKNLIKIGIISAIVLATVLALALVVGLIKGAFAILGYLIVIGLIVFAVIYIRTWWRERQNTTIV
jgi:uncharacterized membrane protein